MYIDQLNEGIVVILFYIILFWFIFRLDTMENRPTWLDSFEAEPTQNLKKNQPGPKNQKLIGVSNPFYIKVESEVKYRQ